MRTVELATIYVAFGVVLGVVWAAVDIRRRWLDAVLLIPLWPIYGPLLWHNTTSNLAGPRAFDEPSDVVQRLEDGGRRLRRIDALLARPEFSAADVEARCEALSHKGVNPRALAAVRARGAAIRRLVDLRTRLADELAAIREMRAQLSVQTALLKLADEPAAEFESLVDELAARVQGLDILLAEDISAADGASTPNGAP